MPEHGTVQPEDLLPTDPDGRGNHTAEGFSVVADDAARLAIVQVAPTTSPLNAGDRGRIIFQSGGAVSGHYIADGVGGWTFLGGDVTLGFVEYFVRASDGNDANDGLTSGTAFATLQPVKDRIPLSINDLILTHMGDGTYVPLSYDVALLSNRVVFFGDGAGTGNGFSTVQASEAAGAGTGAFQVEKVGGGLTPGAHVGQTLIFDDGVAVNSRRHIVDNDANFFFFDRHIGPFSSAGPSAGDNYTVLTCSVIWEQNVPELTIVSGLGITNQGFGSIDRSPNGFAFLQLRYKYDGADNFVTTAFESATCWFSGIEIDATGIIKCTFSTAGGVLWFGTDGTDMAFSELPVELGLTSGDQDWAGWGIAELGEPDALAFFSDGAAATINAWVVMGSLFINREPSQFRLMGRFYGGGFLATIFAGAGYLESGNPVSGRLVIEATAASPDCIRTFDDSHVHLLGSEDLRNTVSGRLLLAEAGSRITITDFGDEGIGSTAGAIAVEARTGGRVYFNFEPNYTGAVDGQDYKAGTLLTGKAGLAVDGDGIAATDNSVIQKIAF